MPVTAGRAAAINVSGNPVAVLAQAMTMAADFKTYQITSTATQGLPWASTASVVVRIAGSSAGVDAYTLYRLNGSVVFTTAASSRAAVTIDTQYLPLSSAANAHRYNLSISAAPLDVSVFGDTWHQKKVGLRYVSGQFSEWYVDKTYAQILTTSSARVVIELFNSTGTTFDCRAWGNLTKSQAGGAVDAIVAGSYDFDGAADNENLAITFSTAGP